MRQTIQQVSLFIKNSTLIKFQEQNFKNINRLKMIEGFFSNLFGVNEEFNEKQRLEKLRNQLMTCTYYNNIKFLIERICMDVMKMNPNFKAQILAFIQNNQPRRFIEIGGILNYKYKNKQRSVQVFMMFNQFFPNKPPYVRVVNYEKKKVHSYYDVYQSPNDNNSYVLNNKLNNITSWTAGKRCVIILYDFQQPIFEELKFLLETYPFYEDQIQQTQSKKKSPQKLKLPQQNDYIANRGSIYQCSISESKPQQTKGNETQDYSEKQCKLCFSAQSTMINSSCGHVMMCEKCCNDYKKKKGTDFLECPICKTRGQYFKFVQPKFV